ncbi:hypothetical protein BX666DRAFT_2070097 [Dichotomocladium elegans]|nr:hypothetical protein BX666DRAFT_2070097 [Dichotomocladium elegans]
MSSAHPDDTLNIYLEHDPLVLHGSTKSKAPGGVLRGVAVLRLDQVCRIRSIILQFQGTITQRHTKKYAHRIELKENQDQEIINHTWTFLPVAENKQPHILHPGTYAYDFELPIPNNVPESTRVGKVYAVQYRLTATADRPGLFLRNYVCEKPVHISRRDVIEAAELSTYTMRSPWTHATHDSSDCGDLSDEPQQPVTIAGHCANGMVEYIFSIPNKSVSQGSDLVLSGHIGALVDNLELLHLSCYFVECMTCRFMRDGPSNKPKVHSRVIQAVQIRDELDSIECRFPVPHSLEDCQVDALNDIVKIRHKIKLVLSLIDPKDGRLTEIRLTIPVKIRPSNDYDLAEWLPAYEEDGRTSLPYDPTLMATLLSHENQKPHPFTTAILPTYEQVTH